MAYSLPAATITEEECKFVMVPIHKVGLAKAGITATIPAAVRSGPIQSGGLGIIDPYLHMGASQVETLVSSIWEGTPTGRLLEIALEDIAMGIGLTNTWDLETLKKGLLYTTTPSWIRHLFAFTTSNNIEVQIGIPLYQQHRLRHDKTIMESALEYTSRKPMILKSINAVQMALQVVWLSDIILANGNDMDNRCFSATSSFPRRNNYRWPPIHHTYDMISGLQDNLRRASIKQYGGYIEVIGTGDNLHDQIPQQQDGLLWSNTVASKESILQNWKKS